MADQVFVGVDKIIAFIGVATNHTPTVLALLKEGDGGLYRLVA
ncbi:hypothetical protein [Mangrovitalea sediminis]|nr:hypothetical protein [Mangrovitalea sediminis]